MSPKMNTSTLPFSPKIGGDRAYYTYPAHCLPRPHTCKRPIATVLKKLVSPFFPVKETIKKNGSLATMAKLPYL